MRELILFQSYGERMMNHREYKNSKFIVCGLCGNMTPEETYLDNNCLSCWGGILCENCEEDCKGPDECKRFNV